MSIESYIDDAIRNSKSITIKYIKYGGEISTRTLSDIKYSDEFGKEYIEGFCHMRQERRTFKISRIREVDGIIAGFNNNSEGKTKSAYNPNTNSYSYINKAAITNTTSTSQTYTYDNSRTRASIPTHLSTDVQNNNNKNYRPSNKNSDFMSAILVICTICRVATAIFAIVNLLRGNFLIFIGLLLLYIFLWCLWWLVFMIEY